MDKEKIEFIWIAAPGLEWNDSNQYPFVQPPASELDLTRRYPLCKEITYLKKEAGPISLGKREK